MRACSQQDNTLGTFSFTAAHRWSAEMVLKQQSWTEGFSTQLRCQPSFGKLGWPCPMSDRNCTLTTAASSVEHAQGKDVFVDGLS
mmetsp:Transcript_87442/g.199820  ORF Transcript_87442/g.199820 Transcript_87442/m.199820 type:complete len:85 (-) Transcript_87442:2732-2986(-)